jgi:RNA polymerase sigma-70 factor (ECF subfamily)
VLVERARLRFPELATSDALTERVAQLAEVDDPSEELVLVAACLLGDRGALATFDREYGTQVRALIAGIAGDRTDDVMQDLRTKLVVAGKLAGYGGRGSLLSWLRVVAAREALSTLRKHRREVAVDDDVMFGKLVAGDDPALALIRSESITAIKRAFATAVAGLAVRERNLLRQHLLDGLTIDDLAPLYNVHRVTVSRWLVTARETVWTATQHTLRSELSLTPSQVESLLASAREYLDLSLERVL